MRNKKTLLIVASALFVVLLLGGGFMYFKDRMPGVGAAMPEGLTDGPAYISDFAVQKPDLVATGENLARVEVWYTPLAGAEPKLLGNAKYQGTSAIPGSESKVQTWTFPIPRQRVQAVEIFARGYDKTGAPVARIGLPGVEGVW